MARPRGCSRPPGHAATGDEADEAGANLGRLAQRRGHAVSRLATGRGAPWQAAGHGVRSPESPKSLDWAALLTTVTVYMLRFLVSGRSKLLLLRHLRARDWNSCVLLLEMIYRPRKTETVRRELGAVGVATGQGVVLQATTDATY